MGDGDEVFDDGNNANNVNENLIIGNYISGSIHGFKFLDKNANGVYEPCGCGDGDTPFEWGIFELLDANGNPVLENGHPVVFTDVDGQFWFTNLAPGSYTLRERPDLVDRNDLDGDGFPDVVDTNGDGFPDQMGNGIPDDQEGLMTSTPDEIQILILSRQEYVYQAGASMLDPVIEVEPDDFSDGAPIVAPPGVTLSVADSDGNIIAGKVVMAKSPNLNRMQPSTGDLVFGHDGLGTTNLKTQWSFEEDRLLRIDFSILVHSVSIDVLGDDSGMDVGAMFAYTAAGDLVDAAISGEIQQFDFETLTVSGANIAYVLVGGLDAGPTEDTVGLDNLTYEIDLLKNEVNVGDDLAFGNFYAGAIHGLKLQLGTNLPAPNIPIELIDAWGQVVATTTTNAEGEYWFLDVIPSEFAYTVSEVATNPTAVLVMANPVSVVVGHAEAVFSSDIPVQNRMYYEGLQTPVEDHALTLRNLISGSIHGDVNSQNGTPVAGLTVNLFGPTTATTQTEADGEFHFEGLLPGHYILMVDGLDPTIVTIDSGEEEAYALGVASLLPGQYETLNPGLIFEVQTTALSCDFDGLNGCDINDIDALITEIVAGTNRPHYDLNQDGIVDLADRDRWLAEAAAVAGFASPYLLGDANLDGMVDGQDFFIWNSNKFSSTGKWSQGDWNADGITDGQDYIIWSGNKFQSSNVQQAPRTPASPAPPFAQSAVRKVDAVFAHLDRESTKEDGAFDRHDFIKKVFTK